MGIRQCCLPLFSRVFFRLCYVFFLFQEDEDGWWCGSDSMFSFENLESGFSGFKIGVIGYVNLCVVLLDASTIWIQQDLFRWMFLERVMCVDASC